MRRLLFFLAICLCGCTLFRQPMTIEQVRAAQIATGPTLTWPASSGAKTYRIWRCQTGSCQTVPYSVGGVSKPFPVSLAQWQIVSETRNNKVRSFPVECDFEYSVQAIGGGTNIANGGNVVKCQ